MQVEERAAGTHWSSGVGGFRLTGWTEVEQILAFRDERRASHPADQLLFILDDASQAAYTGGHASVRS